MDITGNHQLVLELIQVNRGLSLDNLSDKQEIDCIECPLSPAGVQGVWIGNLSKLSAVNVGHSDLQIFGEGHSRKVPTRGVVGDDCHSASRPDLPD